MVNPGDMAAARWSTCLVDLRNPDRDRGPTRFLTLLEGEPCLVVAVDRSWTLVLRSDGSLGWAVSDLLEKVE